MAKDEWTAMTTLVVGASGATGRLLVEQLLQSGQQVRAVVRSSSRFNAPDLSREQLTVIKASIHDASDADISRMVDGCDAIASCLGHNLTFKGLFGHPRQLVTDVTRRLCEAVNLSEPATPVRFVLMNTAGNSNRDLNEPMSRAQRCVIGLLRYGLPPHRDNERAADYLRTVVGQQNTAVEWVIVRPDTLTDATATTNYETDASPTRSAIFDPGKTSRINTAHFMAQLIADDNLWAKWRGQMPVVYNAE